jgi:restriction endonuclease Mrr
MLYDETNQTFFWLISQFSAPIYSTSCYSQDSLFTSSGYLNLIDGAKLDRICARYKVGKVYGNTMKQMKLDKKALQLYII